MRKVLSHPACLSFPRINPFEGSSLARLRALLAQKREVLRPMVLAIAGLILIHDDVEYPVQPILDAPMAAHDSVEAFGVTALLSR